MKHVMVDIETLGTSSDAVILSIGAVQFDPTAVQFGATGLGATFYARVNPQSCVDVGMKIDVSTIMWWFKQGDAARHEVAAGGLSLHNALSELDAWWPKGATFWGNGATFDNVIVSNAYKLASRTKPWGYTADRCYRTVKALYPDIKAVAQPSGVAHNALDDAVYQATHLLAIMRAKDLV